jgi:hypothetical protein
LEDATPVAPSERPATITEAFAREEAGAGSPPATTESETPAVETSADAIVPPAESDPPVSPSSEVKGPLPYERHKAILDGAYKERDSYKAQLDSWKDYEWVRGIPQQEFQAAVTKIQRAASDPVGFFRELVADLDNHPTHSQQLRSEAARLLGKGRGAPETDLSPDVEITDGQGQVVGRTFSAERVQSLMQRAVQDALAKEVGPIRTDYEQRKAEAAAKEAQARTEAQVDDVLSAIKDILGDDQDLWAEYQKAFSDPSNAKVRPETLAARVFNTHGRSKLTAQAKTEELDSLKRKAQASSLSPASAVVAQKRRPTSLTDSSLRW